MNQTKIFGPKLELRRTISSTIGQAAVRIRDVVSNVGNEAAAHMILYHCNYGWPLVDEGTEIVWKGTCKSRGLEMDDELFASGHDYRKCCKVLDKHKGGREACGFIDVKADSKGFCTVGLYNRGLGVAVSMRYKKRQMPWLTNWQHWGKGEYTTALEPGTNPPIGQGHAREQGTLKYIRPGKNRTYDMEIAVLTEQKQISSFLKNSR